jgi:hypothetical protein
MRSIRLKRTETLGRYRARKGAMPNWRAHRSARPLQWRSASRRNSRAALQHPSFSVFKRFLGRCLMIVAIICGVAAVPAAAVSLYTAWFMMVPRYSAVRDFDKYGFNVRLDFYLSNNEPRDSGRYLSVIHESGYYTAMIPGWDWAHRARTSLYRIDDNHLAVLSAQGHDQEVTLKPFAMKSLESDGRGGDWQYLGAFDFTFPPGERPRLAFFDPQQLPECIPMGSEAPATWADKPRAPFRRPTCPTPTLSTD